MQKKILFIWFLFGCVAFSYSQNHTLRGFIYDNKDGSPVGFEKVRLFYANGTIFGGGTTDINGLFTIPKVPKGSYYILIDNFEYETIKHPIEVVQADGISNLKFYLKENSSVTRLDAVEVSAEKIRNKTHVQTSVISLDKVSIERIPTIGAENDIVGALSVTPGVVTTGDQGGQLYVRGGTPIQNKILLDGMTVYSPFHSIGFFSVFETELIRSTDIYTGGFDAKYGGRISSIMDITYRDGNRQRDAFKVSVSPFMVKAVAETPLGARKPDGSPRAGSIILSAKHSLLDYTSKSMYRNINNMSNVGVQGMPYAFTDLYGKITFNGDGGTKFSAFAFHNRDSVDYAIANLDWRSTGGGINFLIVPPSSKTLIKGRLTGSQYTTTFLEDLAPKRTSSIGGFDLGFDFIYYLPKERELNYGINLNGFNTQFITYNELLREINSTNFSTEIGAYISYRYVASRWVVQPSLRVQSYPSVSHISFEPRVGIKFNANEFVRLKASGGRYSQNFTSASSDRDVVNLFNGMLSAPTNFQSNFIGKSGQQRRPQHALQTAWHAIAGVEIDLFKNMTANIEGFYKFFDQLSNINQNKIYEDMPQFDNIDDVYKKDFLLESGQSLGLDFLLKYELKRMHLWAVYSLSRSTRWDGFIEYFPVFDRRHNMNFLLSYYLGKEQNTEINIRWNFGSGLPFTPTSGFYQPEDFQGGITSDPTTNNPAAVGILLAEFNSKRLPDYHRLDLTIKHRIALKKKMEIEIIGSITNLYNRKNIFYVNRVTNDVIYQFPFLPSLGLNWKF